MKIRVREEASYVEMSYIIDSAELYREVMKLHNTNIKDQDVKFCKDGHFTETPQFTEGDIVAVYLGRNGADWLDDYDAIYSSGWRQPAADYILDLCNEVEVELAIGNRKIEEFGSIDYVGREEVKEVE